VLPVVNTCFNIPKLCILATVCNCIFRIIFRKKGDYFLNKFMFQLQTKCILWKVGTELELKKLVESLQNLGNARMAWSYWLVNSPWNLRRFHKLCRELISWKSVQWFPSHEMSQLKHCVWLSRNRKTWGKKFIGYKMHVSFFRITFVETNFLCYKSLVCCSQGVPGNLCNV
jgi:hypothetical protein